MMDYLAEAKKFADYANTRKLEWAQVNAQVAIAHVLIAICERMDKKTADAEAAVYRAELLAEREARRAGAGYLTRRK